LWELEAAIRAAKVNSSRTRLACVEVASGVRMSWRLFSS